MVRVAFPGGTGDVGPGRTRAVRAGVLFFVLFLILYMSATVVPAGHVGVQDFFGTVSDRVLAPGINLVVPGTRVIKFSVQTREIKETAAVPTSEGLIVNLDVSLLFRMQPDAAARVYKTIGRQFEAVVIDPQLRSVIRDVTAEYEAKFLYSGSREVVAQNMFKHMRAALAPRGIEAEQVLLRAVQLPPLLTAAIQEKLQAEQQAQRMRFVLDRERQEAERKRVEAQGIADFQGIVAKGISAELLKWKAIEVAHELSKSPNAKIIVLGDKSGLPIILSDK
ncbi:MAG TPA: prohibitin family protein [Methylomirabilota bacterium]|jgi:regulator of protease activity HflC (stomatin/prohibitin superfamily)